MASSQQRCVFVGNIPYDATEEQLIEICREVGPVVSFRLVIDRETGKPKGYGFCEYKDEETALSARRNLQGYEINGRQLRVDFAENDKGADRNREQGRGGPGMAANVDSHKQLGGPVLHGDSVHHQPIGLHLAITAATGMNGALGGAQVGMQSNQNGIQTQLASPNDPLTLHLAKMSRNQLNEIMSEMKLMATQNKELARQLLLAKPQLLKALFQAQIMLGIVTPQVLQMPNLRQGPGHPAQPLLQDGQQQVVQVSGLPPLAQKTQVMPKAQEGQLQLQNQISASPRPPTHAQIQLPQHAMNQCQQPSSQHGPSKILTLPSVRPQIQIANPSSLNQQIQPPSVENQVQVSAPSLGHNTWINLPNSGIRPSFLPRPPSLDAGFQPGSSTSSGIVQMVSRDGDRSARSAKDATRLHTANMPVGLTSKRSTDNDSLESISRPLKMVKTEDGRGTSLSVGALGASKPTGPAPSQAFRAGVVPKVEEVQYSEKQIRQIPPDEEAALLQQVLRLTPEQVNSLPLEQRQQVIQIQQALLRDQMQPS